MLHTDQKLPCSENPEPWFSKNKKEQARVAALCRTCPQALRCLEDALNLESMLGHRLHGIHGGLTPAQREKTALKRIA